MYFRPAEKGYKNDVAFHLSSGLVNKNKMHCFNDFYIEFFIKLRQATKK